MDDPIIKIKEHLDDVPVTWNNKIQEPSKSLDSLLIANVYPILGKANYNHPHPILILDFKYSPNGRHMASRDDDIPLDLKRIIEQNKPRKKFKIQNKGLDYFGKFSDNIIFCFGLAYGDPLTSTDFFAGMYVDQPEKGEFAVVGYVEPQIARSERAESSRKILQELTQRLRYVVQHKEYRNFRNYVVLLTNLFKELTPGLQESKQTDLYKEVPVAHPYAEAALAVVDLLFKGGEKEALERQIAAASKTYQGTPKLSLGVVKMPPIEDWAGILANANYLVEYLADLEVRSRRQSMADLRTRIEHYVIHESDFQLYGPDEAQKIVDSLKKVSTK